MTNFKKNRVMKYVLLTISLVLGIIALAISLIQNDRFKRNN